MADSTSNRIIWPVDGDGDVPLHPFLAFARGKCVGSNWTLEDLLIDCQQLVRQDKAIDVAVFEGPRLVAAVFSAPEAPAGQAPHLLFHRAATGAAARLR